eukprot:UN02949
MTSSAFNFFYHGPELVLKILLVAWLCSLAFVKQDLLTVY